MKAPNVGMPDHVALTTRFAGGQQCAYAFLLGILVSSQCGTPMRPLILRLHVKPERFTVHGRISKIRFQDIGESLDDDLCSEKHPTEPTHSI
ncbi:hypothetical protein [Bradyrhizobium japonicum]|jgi:hypothetical protein|uniref:hypothetical protein n=2 Tax=Nitrobacteraceae TaxID=41294 RepID=UPI00209F476E|nr:hypothetical protein [Bradyrhizobium japonicum]MCP1768561.1 hypothetical protein [Bradyrhizobium japonicum]MCP1794721.1 hypothetical protein [Bradyrhizobium japonicum]MCP1811013.1 hypothetical protein [Bradyrhizobium japonicum]MCP1943941.1 hypothetical protein [Bradyrhizobium japonicum]MCP1946648.1 hypothetical protein [Bradyrhizobium japonicum]